MMSWCCHDTHEFLIDFLNLLQERVYRTSHWFTNVGGHFSTPSQFFRAAPFLSSSFWFCRVTLAQTDFWRWRYLWTRALVWTVGYDLGLILSSVR